MTIKIQQLTEENRNEWDEYVENHSDANLYHLSGWKDVIENAYGHKTYYLMALKLRSEDLKGTITVNSKEKGINSEVVGILPMVHIKHFIFGNKMISMPFADMGGVVADSMEAQSTLINEALNIASKKNVAAIELRQSIPLNFFSDRKNISISAERNENDLCKVDDVVSDVMIRDDKVRMVLNLPDSADDLMSSFKSKLRSQIRRPIKEKLTYKTGGLDLLDEFYDVFSVNMRDLGSPVHSKSLIDSVLRIFKEKSRIVIVHKGQEPIAGSLVIGFKEILGNPWASSLKRYSKISPNMLLYWAMLEYACRNNYKFFDFGRSTPGEGTFRFKSQWGAEPKPMNWYSLVLDSSLIDDGLSENKRFDMAVRYWQKLPLSISKYIGPKVRKYIGL